MTARDDVWLIVRRSRSIPGGYRVVAHGLLREEAEARARARGGTHTVMSHADLTARRVAALEAARSPQP